MLRSEECKISSLGVPYVCKYLPLPPSAALCIIATPSSPFSFQTKFKFPPLSNNILITQSSLFSLLDRRSIARTWLSGRVRARERERERERISECQIKNNERKEGSLMTWNRARQATTNKNGARTVLTIATLDPLAAAERELTSVVPFVSTASRETYRAVVPFYVK